MASTPLRRSLRPDRRLYVKHGFCLTCGRGTTIPARTVFCMSDTGYGTAVCMEILHCRFARRRKKAYFRIVI